MGLVQVDYSPFQPGTLPQARIGRCQNPYFRHGDALYPFMYAAFVGWLCHIRIFPPWLILLLLSPMYVGGVKLVIVQGEQDMCHPRHARSAAIRGEPHSLLCAPVVQVCGQGSDIWTCLEDFTLRRHPVWHVPEAVWGSVQRPNCPPTSWWPPA